MRIQASLVMALLGAVACQGHESSSSQPQPVATPSLTSLQSDSSSDSNSPQQSPANKSTAGQTDGTTGSDNTSSPQTDPQGKNSGLAVAAATFTLPQRTIEAPARTLWATYYQTPRFTNSVSGFPLLDMKGAPLGPILSHRQWCDAAMEGSVQVQIDGQWKTFNYAGTAGSSQVDCSPYFSHPVGRTRFKPARGPFGDGVANYILFPYRTIAVDPDVISYGSVLYIPAARGLPFTMPDGSRRSHDGYFFAADTGGLIRGNHIDVFIGIDTASPFAWITSNSNSRIEYQIVPDNDLKQALLGLHL